MKAKECISCDGKIDSSAQFCQHCGARQESNQPANNVAKTRSKTAAVSTKASYDVASTFCNSMASVQLLEDFGCFVFLQDGEFASFSLTNWDQDIFFEEEDWPMLEALIDKLRDEGYASDSYAPIEEWEEDDRGDEQITWYFEPKSKPDFSKSKVRNSLLDTLSELAEDPSDFDSRMAAFCVYAIEKTEAILECEHDWEDSEDHDTQVCSSCEISSSTLEEWTEKFGA